MAKDSLQRQQKPSSSWCARNIWRSRMATRARRRSCTGWNAGRAWRMEMHQDTWRGPLTRAEIGAEMLGTFTVYRISRAITMLTKCGFIDVMQGVRHAYDRKQMLRINIDAVQEAIDAWFRIVEDAESQNAKCESEECKMRNRIMEDADPKNAKCESASSTLEDQSLRSESPDQKEDQKAAAEHARERAEAAAAAGSHHRRDAGKFRSTAKRSASPPTPLPRERGDKQPRFLQSGDDRRGEHHSPQFRAPPSPWRVGDGV
ncbi:MAG: hypothetical protein IPO91_33800 [Chloroflexi bacterium]|nr:hypothetical protein [Chloroflexota bacterium]